MIATKNNPFGAKRIQAVGYIQQGPSLEQIGLRLKQLNYTAAIVGPHGSGKSTLLRYLVQTLNQCGVQTRKLFINLDNKLPWRTIQHTIRSIPPEGALFFDGANHLPFLRFRQLRSMTQKQNIGLVITSHDEGLLPTLIHCQPQLELLIKVTERLLPEEEIIERSYLAELFELHKGNIRDCLWQLYDEYADCETVSTQPPGIIIKERAER